MEDLLEKIEKSCLVTPESDEKRKSQYKYNCRSEESARDKRRLQLLEICRRKRNALLAEKRGLIDDDFSDGENWLDWQSTRGRNQKQLNCNCKNQLMLSEWLMDHPLDLDTRWTCVICPEGHRTLVIAKNGCTRAYHKSGFLLARFQSILPSGSPDSRTQNSDIIILDCIWKKTTKQLFALDVLYWKNQPLLNCDAQFRLYWVKSKLTEVKRGASVSKDVYDVFLPHHCTLSTLFDGLSQQDPSQVDGVLFFHNDAPYISGQTPLVGWLKPFMIPERLGLSIPEPYLTQKPSDYKNLEEWVAKVKHSHTRNLRYRKKDKMEIETDSSSTQTSISDASTGEMEFITSNLSCVKEPMDL